MQWSADFLTSSETCILLMTKTPILGDVKSRLATEIGETSALELYTCFLKDMVETLRGLDADYIIYYTPEESLDLLKNYLGANHKFVPQVGNDLGERIYQGLEIAHTLGYQYSIALASDVPDITENYLRKARMELMRHQAVIGPSHDGGYNLIGFNLEDINSGFFNGLQWSTENVYMETLKRLSGVDIYVLPVWGDVDKTSDLFDLDLDKTTYTYKYIKEHKLI